MAAPTWRMNGLWRRMAGVLVLCVLLLSSEVMCQDDAAADATDVPAAADAGDAADPADPADAGDAADPADAGVTADPADAGDAADPADAGDATGPADAGDAADAADNAVTDAAGSAVAPDTTVPSLAAEDAYFTMINIINPDNQDGGTSGPSAITVAPVVRDEVAAPAEVPDGSHKLAVPEVMCVGESDISEGHGITVEVETADCEEARRIILENSASWCKTQQCTLKVFQKGKRLLIASDDAERSDLDQAFQSAHLRDKLTKSPSSSGSSVFVGILVSGLLAAVAITVGYFKCQRRATTKGVRLAEEAYPAGDQENQGNTLVSVAPLNPPPETQEKPSVNGESPEAAKTQPPPPTNGHSTTKTADTEM